MKLIFTQYLYPISEKTTFLGKYGYYFDNARTPKDISDIERMLQKAIPDRGKSLLWRYGFETKGGHHATLNNFIEQVFNHLPQDNSYINKFIDKYRDNDPLNTLARMWVLVRIDKNKLKEFKRLSALKEKASEIENAYVGCTNPEVFLVERLYDFAHLAALLMCRYEYWDYESFLSCRSPYIGNEDLASIVGAYCFATVPGQAIEGVQPLPWFHEDIQTLLSVFNNIETELNNDNCELFEYLANLIYTSVASELTGKGRLLLLVSVIELLLTYSPDYSRFNIEDSINKQFQLKTALVVYQNNKNRNINEIRESLKHIYDVRSKIAHGDFKSLKKIIQKKSSASEYSLDIEDYYLHKLNNLLYTYIKAILEEYFKDRDYVRFIKEH
ncbi:MAG TPA: hypothetical protein VKF36_16475 [Syntrophorhabdales bacterium]|nr:hypothetical protein [Syntrophorhabdales bacterium]